VEIWAKCVNTFAKYLYVCFDFTKMARKIKAQTFQFFFGGRILFSSFRASSGKFGQMREKFGLKWCLKCFDLKKCVQHEKKYSRFVFVFFFGGHNLWSIFRASLGKFGQKSFAPPKF